MSSAAPGAGSAPGAAGGGGNNIRSVLVYGSPETSDPTFDQSAPPLPTPGTVPRSPRRPATVTSGHSPAASPPLSPGRRPQLVVQTRVDPNLQLQQVPLPGPLPLPFTQAVAGAGGPSATAATHHGRGVALAGPSHLRPQQQSAEVAPSTAYSAVAGSSSSRREGHDPGQASSAPFGSACPTVPEDDQPTVLHVGGVPVQQAVQRPAAAAAAAGTHGGAAAQGMGRAPSHILLACDQGLTPLEWTIGGESPRATATELHNAQGAWWTSAGASTVDEASQHQYAQHYSQQFPGYQQQGEGLDFAPVALPLPPLAPGGVRSQQLHTSSFPAQYGSAIGDEAGVSGWHHTVAATSQQHYQSQQPPVSGTLDTAEGSVIEYDDSGRLPMFRDHHGHHDSGVIGSHMGSPGDMGYPLDHGEDGGAMLIPLGDAEGAEATLGPLDLPSPRHLPLNFTAARVSMESSATTVTTGSGAGSPVLLSPARVRTHTVTMTVAGDDVEEQGPATAAALSALASSLAATAAGSGAPGPASAGGVGAGGVSSTRQGNGPDAASRPSAAGQQPSIVGTLSLGVPAGAAGHPGGLGGGGRAGSINREHRQRWMDQVRDAFSLALFYATQIVDIAVIATLAGSGCPPVWWSLCLVFILAHLVATALVLLMHNGWLAICIRYFFTLLKTESTALQKTWPLFDFLRYVVVGFTIAIMASFGTLITFYCLLCFMLVSFICVPVLDISAIIATLVPPSYKGRFRAADLIFLEHYKSARFSLQALLESLPQAALMIAAMVVLDPGSNRSSEEGGSSSGNTCKSSPSIAPLCISLAFAIANLVDKASHLVTQIMLMESNKGVLGMLRIWKHTRDIMTLRGGYRVPVPVMEVTLSQMLRSNNDLVVTAHEVGRSTTSLAPARSLPNLLLGPPTPGFGRSRQPPQLAQHSGPTVYRGQVGTGTGRHSLDDRTLATQQHTNNNVALQVPRPVAPSPLGAAPAGPAAPSASHGTASGAGAAAPVAHSVPGGRPSGQQQQSQQQLVHQRVERLRQAAASVVSPFAAASAAPAAGRAAAENTAAGGGGAPQAAAARVGSGAPPTPRALPGNAVLGFFRNASGGLALTQTLQPRMSTSQVPGNQRQWPLVPRFLLPSGGGQLVPAQMLSVIKEAMARVSHHAVTSWALELPGDACLVGMMTDGLTRFQQLRQLTICKCKLGGRGFGRVSELLVSHPSLRTLRLVKVQVDAKGASALEDLVRSNHLVTTLQLTSCTLPSARLATRLLRTLRHNSTLTSLTLSGCGMNKSLVATLAEALAGNTSLTKLDLTGNKQLGQSGAAALVELLSNWRLPDEAALLAQFSVAVSQLGVHQQKPGEQVQGGRQSRVTADGSGHVGAAGGGDHVAVTIHEEGLAGSTLTGSAALQVAGTVTASPDGVDGAEQEAQPVAGGGLTLPATLHIGVSIADIGQSGALLLTQCLAQRNTKLRASIASALAQLHQQQLERAQQRQLQAMAEASRAWLSEKSGHGQGHISVTMGVDLGNDQTAAGELPATGTVDGASPTAAGPTASRFRLRFGGTISQAAATATSSSSSTGAATRHRRSNSEPLSLPGKLRTASKGSALPTGAGHSFEALTPKDSVRPSMEGGDEHHHNVNPLFQQLHHLQQLSSGKAPPQTPSTLVSSVLSLAQAQAQWAAYAHRVQAPAQSAGAHAATGEGSFSAGAGASPSAAAAAAALAAMLPGIPAPPVATGNSASAHSAAVGAGGSGGAATGLTRRVTPPVLALGPRQGAGGYSNNGALPGFGSCVVAPESVTSGSRGVGVTLLGPENVQARVSGLNVALVRGAHRVGVAVPETIAVSLPAPGGDAPSMPATSTAAGVGAAGLDPPHAAPHTFTLVDPLTLTLVCEEEGQEWEEVLTGAQKIFDSLTSLDLSGLPLSPSSAAALAECLSLSGLQHLKVANCRLIDTAAVRLVVALQDWCEAACAASNAGAAAAAAAAGGEQGTKGGTKGHGSSTGVPPPASTMVSCLTAGPSHSFSGALGVLRAVDAPPAVISAAAAAIVAAINSGAGAGSLGGSNTLLAGFGGHTAGQTAGQKTNFPMWPLAELDLSDNHLSDDVAEAISRACKNVARLRADAATRAVRALASAHTAQRAAHAAAAAAEEAQGSAVSAAAAPAVGASMSAGSTDTAGHTTKEAASAASQHAVIQLYPVLQQDASSAAADSPQQQPDQHGAGTNPSSHSAPHTSVTVLPPVGASHSGTPVPAAGSTPSGGMSHLLGSLIPFTRSAASVSTTGAAAAAAAAATALAKQAATEAATATQEAVAAVSHLSRLLTITPIKVVMCDGYYPLSMQALQSLQAGVTAASKPPCFLAAAAAAAAAAHASAGEGAAPGAVGGAGSGGSTGAPLGTTTAAHAGGTHLPQVPEEGEEGSVRGGKGSPRGGDHHTSSSSSGSRPTSSSHQRDVISEEEDEEKSEIQQEGECDQGVTRNEEDAVTLAEVAAALASQWGASMGPVLPGASMGHVVPPAVQSVGPSGTPAPAASVTSIPTLVVQLMRDSAPAAPPPIAGQQQPTGPTTAGAAPGGSAAAAAGLVPLPPVPVPAISTHIRGGSSTAGTPTAAAMFGAGSAGQAGGISPHHPHLHSAPGTPVTLGAAATPGSATAAVGGGAAAFRSFPLLSAPQPGPAAGLQNSAQPSLQLPPAMVSQPGPAVSLAAQQGAAHPSFQLPPAMVAAVAAGGGGSPVAGRQSVQHFSIDRLGAAGERAVPLLRHSYGGSYGNPLAAAGAASGTSQLSQPPTPPAYLGGATTAHGPYRSPAGSGGGALNPAPNPVTLPLTLPTGTSVAAVPCIAGPPGSTSNTGAPTAGPLDRMAPMHLPPLPSGYHARAPSLSSMVGGPAAGPGAGVGGGRHSRTASHMSGSSDGDLICSVCFDNPNALSINPCQHRLCVTCYRHLVKPPTARPQGNVPRAPPPTATCPFCRARIEGFNYRINIGAALS